MAVGPAGQSAFNVLTVTAQVQPSAVLRYEASSAPLTVTPEDILRGYIDVPRASLLAVNAGMLTPSVIVDFTPVAGLFESVDIRAEKVNVAAARLSELPPPGAGRPIAVAEDALGASLKTLAEPVASNVPETIASGGTASTLTYRISLSQSAKPGNYPLPLTVSVNL